MRTTIEKKTPQILFDANVNGKIPIEAAQQIVGTVLDYADTITESVARTATMKDWFKEFVKSEAFAKLDADTKDMAFEHLYNLSHVMRQLDDCFATYGLGDYKQA